MPDCYGTKGMWVNRMLDPHCDFELWPHPWPWPLIFKVKFWKSRISGMGGPIDMERKECESIGYYNTHSTQKSPVRQQNAWIDTKKPGSTQKCPVRHKNALPSMHQLTLPLSNTPPPPPPSCEKYFFSNFIPIFFLRTNREMKMKLFWYEFKISIFNIILNIEMQ